MNILSIFEPAEPTTSNASPEGQEATGAAVSTESQGISQGTEDNTSETGETTSPDTTGQEVTEKPAFDYEKAYSELRKDYTKKSQELSELKKTSQQSPQQQQRQAEDIVNMQGWDKDTKDTFWAAFEEDPQAALSLVVQNMLPNTVQQTIQQALQPLLAREQAHQEQETVKAVSGTIKDLSKQYPSLATKEGLGKLMDTVKEIANDLGNPGLVENPSPRILRMAAQEAFPQDQAQLIEALKLQGANEAVENIRAKQGASAKSGKAQTEQKSSADAIKEAILNASKGGGFWG